MSLEGMARRMRWPFAVLVKAEARIGLRGAPIRLAVAFCIVLGWIVGNAAGSGAGLSAAATGDAASVYLALVTVYWLSLVATRDAAVSATAIVLSKPQPTERLVIARFLGGYLQVLGLLLALFAGAMVSRLYHAGNLVGFQAYFLQYLRAAVVLFFAGALAYTLALMAGTPLAGALAGMYWIVTLAGQEYLAKVYYPYYTQNLPAFACAGLFLLGIAALSHRRSRRGAQRPHGVYYALPIVALASGVLAVQAVIIRGHDPLMRRSPFMEEVARQDATLLYRSPGFTLPDQHGRLVSPSDTPGRIFVIALVDPKTEEGVLTLDRLRAIYAAHARAGVQPVAVCISNDQGAARTVAMGERLGYPVLVDWGAHHAPKTAELSPVAEAFRVNDMPYVAVTDRRRRIRSIIEGIAAYDGPAVEQAVEERLAEEPQ